jgi:two-component system chemotaxis response regulator CheY
MQAQHFIDETPARRLITVEPHARILFVDDEPQLRTLGKRALGGSGYDVDAAVDGVEAWAALHDRGYHLLITDNEMPRLSGLELAARARRAGMRIPIVLTSNSADAARHPIDSRLGLAGCLPKPFRAEALVGIAAQVLAIANRGGECADAVLSFLTRIARVQPFPHGGINE